MLARTIALTIGAMTDHERYHSARRDPTRVVLEGLHALKHAVRFGARLEDIVTDDLDALTELAHRLAPDLAVDLASCVLPASMPTLPVRTVPADVLRSLAPAPHPTRVLALAGRPVHDTDAIVRDARSGGLVVVLEEPRNAGNAGAAVRVAAAAGAAGLFTTGSLDPWGPAAVRGGAGLQFALPVAGLGDAALVLSSQRPVIAVDPEGHDLDRGALPVDAILVFGSERDGVSAALLERADARVRIPMRAGVSSLNLATAVAIMLYR